jgi:beta-glucanase (GH16 family)
LAAELDFHEHNVTYASLRFSARVRGESGAIAGFFTYHNDTSESDIEIPSGGSGEEMHCSNQPTEDPATDKPIKDATFNVSMEKHQPTLTWNNYRLDWVNGRTVWYTNGVQSADTRVNVPDDSSMIILNMWSNGGPFSGRMDKGGKAWLDIQWVELLFNSTSSQKSVSLNDGTLCSTEESLGAPEESAASRSGFGGSYFWLVIGLVSVLASGSLTT